MAEVKLYGLWYSPFTVRLVLSLKLKGIPYEYIEEDRVNKSPQLLQYNPVHKRTPVFVHAGKPICESMIIVEYIDEIWPQNPLVPADPYKRALARFWVRYADDMVVDRASDLFSGGDPVRKWLLEPLHRNQQCIAAFGRKKKERLDAHQAAC